MRRALLVGHRAQPRHDHPGLPAREQRRPGGAARDAGGGGTRGTSAVARRCHVARRLPVPRPRRPREDCPARPRAPPGSRSSQRVARRQDPRRRTLPRPGGARRGSHSRARTERGLGPRHRIPIHTRLLRPLRNGHRVRGLHRALRRRLARRDLRSRRSRRALASLVARLPAHGIPAVRNRRGDLGAVARRAARPVLERRRAREVRDGLHARDGRERRLALPPTLAGGTAHAVAALPPRLGDLHARRRVRHRVRRPLRVLVHPCARRHVRAPRQHLAETPAGRVRRRRSHVRDRVRVRAVPGSVGGRDVRKLGVDGGLRRLPEHAAQVGHLPPTALRRVSRRDRRGNRPPGPDGRATRRS